jgi:hypothetical protein
LYVRKADSRTDESQEKLEEGMSTGEILMLEKDAPITARFHVNLHPFPVTALWLTGQSDSHPVSRSYKAQDFCWLEK